MDRRDFLKFSTSSGIFLGLGPLASFQALAGDDGKPWYFVQVHISGGWDVTLGADPWLPAKPADKEMFIEYEPANLARVGNLTFGPSMMPMKSFASQMTVINGIFMSATDNGHDAAGNYILSGTTNQQWGILPVEIMENIAPEFLGILNNQGAYAGSRSPMLTNLASVQNLAIGSSTDAPFDSSENARNRLSNLAGELAKSADQITALKQILVGYGAGTQLQDGHYLAAAFASGFSRVAFYRTSDNLDSHSGHPGTHIVSQQKSWQTVADMIAIFQKTPLGSTGQSIYDRTTFFITSEFARTAALNPSQGKDHNPLTNSVVLLGPGIKGNNLVGGSHLVTSAQSKTGSSYHMASPVDPLSGQALSARVGNAMILRPENIAASIIESLGISRRRFASVNPKVPSISKLIQK